MESQNHPVKDKEAKPDASGLRKAKLSDVSFTVLLEAQIKCSKNYCLFGSDLIFLNMF